MTTEVLYAVVDDYGDEWEDGYLSFTASSLDECVEWAESENFHSASIVRIVNGVRFRVM